MVQSNRVVTDESRRTDFSRIYSIYDRKELLYKTAFVIYIDRTKIDLGLQKIICFWRGRKNDSIRSRERVRDE